MSQPYQTSVGFCSQAAERLASEQCLAQGCKPRFPTRSKSTWNTVAEGTAVVFFLHLVLSCNSQWQFNGTHKTLLGKHFLCNLESTLAAWPGSSMAISLPCHAPSPFGKEAQPKPFGGGYSSACSTAAFTGPLSKVMRCLWALGKAEKGFWALQLWSQVPECHLRSFNLLGDLAGCTVRNIVGTFRFRFVIRSRQ